MDDLFSRKPRRSPVLVAGTILFGILAVASFVEAARDTPLVFSGAEVSSPLERIGYRAGAGLLCAFLAVAIFPRGGPPGLTEKGPI